MRICAASDASGEMICALIIRVKRCERAGEARIKVHTLQYLFEPQTNNVSASTSTSLPSTRTPFALSAFLLEGGVSL